VHDRALASGATQAITLHVTVSASAPGGAPTNTATVSSPTPDPNPSNNSSSATIGITPVADLALVKSVSPQTASVGDVVTYTFAVTNHGPGTAQRPTVTDVFSAPVTVLSVHPSTGSCQRPHKHAITCTLAAIANGASASASASATIRIVAKPTSIGKLRNTASVASPTPEPHPANNTAHVVTKVRPGPAALRLTKTASTHRVKPGQAFSFAITVHSLGPEPALRVQVCDRLGSGMAFISVDHASFSHGRACWKIDSLAKGKVRRYVVKARALAVATGGRRLINVATARADGVRTKTARASVVVAPPPQVPAPVTG
jgi:large repetitive protein